MALAICSNCGIKFSKQRNKVEQDKRHFCCMDCYAEWMKNNREFFQNKVKKHGKEKRKM